MILSDKQLRAIHAKKNSPVYCDFNFCCEDYAKDGTAKMWDYGTEPNAFAKYKIEYSHKETE